MISSSVNLTITTDLNSSVPEYGGKCLDKSYVLDFTIPTTQTSVTLSKNTDEQISHLPIEGKLVFQGSTTLATTTLEGKGILISKKIHIEANTNLIIKSDTGISTTEITGKGNIIFKAGSIFNGHIMQEESCLVGEGAIDHLTSLAVSLESTDL